jgi:hypothetical protein
MLRFKRNVREEKVRWRELGKKKNWTEKFEHKYLNI